MIVELKKLYSFHKQIWADHRQSISRWLIFFALGFSGGLFGYAQTAKPPEQGQIRKLTLKEYMLVQSSKAAIIGTGISATYFDEHFKLERVLETAGDRRVVWKYSIGEYEAILNDAVGFHTDDKGQRINLHAIRNTLSNAHDIKSVIPKKRAEQLMKQCIGEYRSGAVVFQAFGETQRTALLFTASTIPAPPKDSKANEKPLIHTGFINLETGACTKGIAQAGRPRPVSK